MRMPGGSRFNEETRQFAFFMLGVVLLIFFLLILRMQWDKREGARELDLRVLTNRAALQRAVIGGGRAAMSDLKRRSNDTGG